MANYVFLPISGGRQGNSPLNDVDSHRKEKSASS